MTAAALVTDPSLFVPLRSRGGRNAEVRLKILILFLLLAGNGPPFDLETRASERTCLVITRLLLVFFFAEPPFAPFDVVSNSLSAPLSIVE